MAYICQNANIPALNRLPPKLRALKNIPQGTRKWNIIAIALFFLDSSVLPSSLYDASWNCWRTNGNWGTIQCCQCVAFFAGSGLKMTITYYWFYYMIVGDAMWNTNLDQILPSSHFLFRVSHWNLFTVWNWYVTCI